MVVFSSKRTFTDGRRVTRFEAITDTEMSHDQIADMQTGLGYHPAGYFGPDRVVVRVGSGENQGRFVTTWECSGSCD